jgi:hypothetical protein
MSEETASVDAGELPAVLAAETGSRLHAALTGVITVAGIAIDSADAAQLVVDALADDLELAQARLYLLTSEGDAEGHTHLELAAAAGSHAALTRKMPSVALDTESDIARVGDTGEPEFHGDTHGLGQRPEGGHKGLGRWRSGVSTQASALLPLSVRTRSLGVLSLEWPSPRDFAEEERSDLSAIASTVALVIDSFLAEELERVDGPIAPDVIVLSEPVAEPPVLAEQPARLDVTAQLVVTREGFVLPALNSGPWTDAPALKLQVRTSAHASEQEATFWDVAGFADGTVVLVVGTVTAPQGGAAATAETIRNMLRASASQGQGPAQAMGMVAGWLATTGVNSVWISGVMLEIDVEKRWTTWCSAGSAATMMRYGDGRFGVDSANHSPLGAVAGSQLASRDALLIPGDLLALVCGEVDRLATGLGRTDLVGSLAAEDGPDRLLEALRTQSGTGALIVIESCGPIEH